MASHVQETTAPRLARSCGPAPGDWLQTAPSRPGVERLEASFAGHGFDPHRHDTYAVGYTRRGVQAFRYRGAVQHSHPRAVFVLHPDETHDGRAGTAAGFRYRILYLDPRLVQRALGARTLPFVRDAVSTDRRLARAIVPALADLDVAPEALQQDAIVLAIAEALAAADPSFTRRRPAARHDRAVSTARDFLDSSVGGPVSSSELERVAGVFRFALARQFRACCGTSPYRYHLMRRLDRVRVLIRAGTPLAEAALAGGFADQSHMTRHFRRAYGLPPGRWAAMTAAPRATADD